MTPRKEKPRRLRRLLFWLVLLCLVGATASVPIHQRWQREEAARLEGVRDELRDELARLLANDPRLSQAPPGGVLIGAPAPFTSHLAHQLVGGLLEHTEIHLANLRVRKKGTVNVGTLLGRMTPGAYTLDVKVIEVRGRLGTGEPEIHYENDRARVKVPARIRDGQGRATIRFQWESKGLAGLACGDIDVTQKVDGRVVPHTYPVEGALELVLEGDTVTAVPRVPDLEIRLYVEASKASWRAVDRLLESQGLRCRAALKLVDVPKALQGLLDRGFKVKIPRRIFKPVRLPAGYRKSMTLGGTTYALRVEPRGLQAVEDILWYGADLTAEADAPSPPVIALPAASPVPLPESTAPDRVGGR
ncbi:MAG: hypothetical protein LJF15_12570 [Acidobacteria bacterium]|nr:hypothetical protein [Acidobacteriota bacterium]